MKKILVAPSILSANFANLEKDIQMVENAGADWLHIDVMDGHFVPNITIGPDIVKSIRKITNLFFDVHLMISEPQKYYQDFKKSGANLITFHNEVDINKKKLIQDIKTYNIKAGISIKPKTNISEIEDLLPYLDLVLVMTVEPGFGGQSFMDDMIGKIKDLKSIINKYKYNCLVEVDGGINNQTAIVCVNAGADVLVSGSYIFSSTNLKKSIESLTL
ncbi:MAG: ribulose-phosphate 3-epimerase [Endomicrobium sp.]|jgi:ribulose-phosphate 3-epimerase|uniref:ribulose-phosphate 3-epimerase n=1 Tax=Candidatus Endomicrobiellum cubanum TaxID=3242325 RepID=UPI0028310A66|nr:ribulose-phosphate 3-epimerase [Endomicrobium sp.]